MSYERRVEIEALPAEEGWTKWQAVIGHGTELVERKELAESTLWVARSTGPSKVQVHRYERWRFAHQGRVVDERYFCYTQWHTNYEYTDYSLKARSPLDSICAATEEQVREKVCALLDKELEELRKQTAEKRALWEIFK